MAAGLTPRTETTVTDARALLGDAITMQLKFDWLIVLENLRRGIMVTDTTLNGPAGPPIIYVNRAWLKMTGYGRDELAGKNPRMPQGKHTDRAVVSSLKHVSRKKSR